MLKKPLLRTSKDGANSQERLLEAAVDVFGKQGFEAATTRMIAKAAGVNIAAIPYYFSGKEGLYLAAVSHIVGKIESQLSPAVKEIVARSGGDILSPDEALGLLEMFLENFINFMLGSAEALRFARIILREQLYPSSAYDIIFSRIMAPMMGAVSTLVAAVSGESSPRTAKLRAAAIVGQVLVFRVAREAMVRALGMEGYSAGEVAEIRNVILQQTRASMNLKMGQ